MDNLLTFIIVQFGNTHTALTQWFLSNDKEKKINSDAVFARRLCKDC